MAVTTQSITFGGVNSANYGIFISGEGVFNAPKRAVELVKVPGRNGSVAIDQGYYENITVTYPAVYKGSDLSAFASNIANYRNALASKVGYQRLTDTVHANEYRMAIFSDGIKIDPIKYSPAATFDIVFECKPQRWLVSGETQTALTSGDTVTNPTLYDASPLLVANGSGTISFNGYDIELANSGVVGNVQLVAANAGSATSGTVTYKNFDSSLYLSSDIISIGEYRMTTYITLTDPATGMTITGPLNGNVSPFGSGFTEYALSITCPAYSIAASNTSNRAETVQLDIDHGGYSTTIKLRYNVKYSNDRLEWSGTVTVTGDTTGITVGSGSVDVRIDYDATTVYSNKAALDIYIDCDLGEVYTIENGTVIDMNSYVDLGSDLPTLAPGANTVTFDNTLTLNITPRWWQL